MKKMLTAALLAVAACGFAVANAKDDAGGKKPPATTQSSAPINKYCAVMPEDEVDPNVTVEYKGNTIGFCCKECIPEFKKDPERYLKDLK